MSILWKDLKCVVVVFVVFVVVVVVIVVIVVVRRPPLVVIVRCLYLLSSHVSALVTLQHFNV